MNIIEVDYSNVKCSFRTVLVYHGDWCYFSELVTFYADNSPILNNVWHIDNSRKNPFETKLN